MRRVASTVSATFLAGRKDHYLVFTILAGFDVLCKPLKVDEINLGQIVRIYILQIVDSGLTAVEVKIPFANFTIVQPIR